MGHGVYYIGRLYKTCGRCSVTSSWGEPRLRSGKKKKNMRPPNHTNVKCKGNTLGFVVVYGMYGFTAPLRLSTPWIINNIISLFVSEGFSLEHKYILIKPERIQMGLDNALAAIHSWQGAERDVGCSVQDWNVSILEQQKKSNHFSYY